MPVQALLKNWAGMVASPPGYGGNIQLPPAWWTVLRSTTQRDSEAAIDEAGTIYLYGTGNEQKAIGEEFKRIF